VQIAKCIFDQIDAACVSALLLHHRDISELPERGSARVVGGQSGSAMEFDLPFEVIAQLGIEILIDTTAVEERPNAKTDRSEQAHGFLG
jgi:hypothetical protein